MDWVKGYLSIEGVRINLGVVGDAADRALLAIAKAVPEESLCVAVIEEILEKAKRKARTTPIGRMKGGDENGLFAN